jgi:hypothetical protein
MIFDYYMAQLLHQQRLEQASREEPRLRMIRELERGRRPGKRRRPTLSSRARARPAQSSLPRATCADSRPAEPCCQAA